MKMTGPILLSIDRPWRIWRIKRIGNFLAAGIVLTLRNGGGVNMTLQTYGRHSFPMYDLYRDADDETAETD